MSRARKPALLLALVLLASLLSGCVFVKPESLQLSQAGGVGPVRLQLGLCTYSSGFPAGEPCKPREGENQAQLMLGMALPKGTSTPLTVTAAPGPGATPISYARNEEVAAKIDEEALTFEEEAWPPPGLEVVGYLSEVIDEKDGDNLEWTIGADLGLPAAADGGSFGAPFDAEVVAGWRVVDAEHPASRPIQCFETEGEPPFPGPNSGCGFPESVQLLISDLRVAAPPGTTRGLLGGKASLPFALDFASSAGANPTFAMSASTTVPRGSTSLPVPTFTPGPLSPPANRAVPASRAVEVSIPAKAKPGIYDVTLAATSPAGGVVRQVAKLRVAKPRVGFGKLRLNRKKGTATLQVKVFEAGTLSVFGKKVAKVKRKPKKRRTLTVVIRAKGKAKKALNQAGRAKVRAKARFKPGSGAAVIKSRAIGLVKRLPS